jgi:hypothetical protein
MERKKNPSIQGLHAAAFTVLIEASSLHVRIFFMNARTSKDGCSRRRYQPLNGPAMHTHLSSTSALCMDQPLKEADRLD